MFKRTKKFFNKRVENVKRGMGVPIMTNFFYVIRDIIKGFFAIPEAGEKENFQEAVERYGLSEKDLKNRCTAFTRQAYLFIFFATIVLLYAIYLVYRSFVISGFVTFTMAVMLMILGLRSHFWAFQIEHRKIGCTWREWLNGKTQNFAIDKKKGDQ